MIIEVPYFKYAAQYKLWEMKNRAMVDKHNIVLKVYDGIPNSPWNGGRWPIDTPVPNNVPVSFALTNHTIDDFDDQVSHNCLREHHKATNTIIISNLDLLEHLKKLYPLYKYIYSITAYDISNGFDGYDEIEKLVDYIVPRNEIVNEGDEFYKRNTKQYILLYSYECSYCPLYTDHYKMIGEIVANKDESRKELIQCWFTDRDLLVKAGYDSSIYDGYKYMTSGKFHKKLRAIKPSILAGYKVGRNGRTKQSWDGVEAELNEIVELIDNESL